MSGYNRPRPWRSLRVRILIPVLTATAGVLILGAIQTTEALGVAARADRAIALARACGAVVSLVHEVGLEYVATNAALVENGSERLLTEQRARTDAARREFDRAVQAARLAAPELAGPFDDADGSLDLLDPGRVVALQTTVGSAEVGAVYDAIVNALVSLADSFPAHMTSAELFELARAVAGVAELDYLAARQLDMLARAFGSGEPLAPDDLTQLAKWAGVEARHVDALAHVGAVGSRYRALVNGPRVGSAEAMRDAVLNSSTPEQLTVALAADPSIWISAESDRQRWLRVLASELARTLEQEARRVGQAARDETLVTGALVTSVAAATLVGAFILALRTSRRLRHTRRAALAAARVELPAAVENVITARDATAVRAALNDSWSRVDAMLSVGPDEIGGLASAFGTVHRQALRLAADQALLRMEIEAMFVSLSRRGQTLVQRQIHLIDEFGRHETDPDALSRLFALDHLAARMRRNEENLLVLAGGEPGRWITRPAAVVDVLRAAAQETEEYRRVEVADAPDIAVAAHVAGDVIHLLAELLENATSFSPPNAPVRVTARRTVDGLTVAVFDNGIGIPADRLAEVNERLAQPSGLTSNLVGTMGLLVVARLAQRHHMTVRLTSTPGAGTAASVTIPDHALAPLSASDALQPGRWMLELRSDAARMATPPPSPALPTLPTVSAAPAARPAAVSAIAAAPPPPVARTTASAPAPRGAGPVMPRQREPEPIEQLHSSDTTTPTGLPRRGPRLLLSDSDGSFDLARPGPPDPETVRARLSSLASGIAAATRRDPPPPPIVTAQPTQGSR